MVERCKGCKAHPCAGCSLLHPAFVARCGYTLAPENLLASPAAFPGTGLSPSWIWQSPCQPRGKLPFLGRCQLRVVRAARNVGEGAVKGCQRRSHEIPMSRGISHARETLSILQTSERFLDAPGFGVDFRPPPRPSFSHPFSRKPAGCAFFPASSPLPNQPSGILLESESHPKQMIWVHTAQSSLQAQLSFPPQPDQDLTDALATLLHCFVGESRIFFPQAASLHHLGFCLLLTSKGVILWL